MDRYGCIRRKKSRRQLLLAYLAARIVFPEQIAMRLGVPLLVASIPQDAFYGIDNDVLSPICFRDYVHLHHPMA